MSRTIILEGPDGAGKTTLASNLEAKGYYYIHNGLYPDDTPQQLFDRYTDQIVAATRLDVPTVIDRSYMSELIYGNVMRNDSRFDHNTIQLFQRLTISQDVREVICLPEWETVKTNWYEKRKEKFDPVNRKGDYVNAVTKLNSIYRMYQSALLDNRPFLSYNYKFDSISILSELSPLFNGRYSKLYWGTVGSPRAIYLVVGEQVNLKKSRHDLPFWDLSASSEFLNRSLREANNWHIGEPDFAFTNAYDHAGRPQRLRSIIKHCLPRFWRAIALGKKAAERCEQEEIPFKMIPHPSYWKRFHSKETRQYNSMLQEALCG